MLIEINLIIFNKLSSIEIFSPVIFLLAPPLQIQKTTQDYFFGETKQEEAKMIQIEKRQEPGWVEYVKTHFQGAERLCRHVLTGRIDAPKIYPLSYECFHCAFDQMMDEYELAPRYYN